MVKYFVDFYGTFSFNHYVGVLINSICVMLVLLDFKKSKAMFCKIPVAILFNYAAITFVSAAYYGLFPDSQYGYFLCPVIYCGISYLFTSFVLNGRATLGHGINVTLMCCLICCTPPLCMPVVLYEMKNEFLRNFRLFSYGLQLVISVLLAVYLNKFSFDSFKQVNIFTIALIFSVCLIGYIIDGIAIVLIKIPSDTGFSYNFFLCLLILFLEYLSFYICYFTNKRSEEQDSVRLENERIKRELETLKSYEFGYTQVRMVKHDIEGQYAIINSLLKQGQYKEATDYFDSLKIMVAPLYQYVYSDNRVINLALNLAAEKGKSKGVRFNFKVATPKELSIPGNVLTSILNNLLTNCIDGVKNLPEDKKAVDVSIALMDSFIAIRTSNFFDKDKVVFNKKGELLTSKINKKDHGYGTKIVAKTAKEHGGVASFKIDGDKFVVDVLLQNKEEKV